MVYNKRISYENKKEVKIRPKAWGERSYNTRVRKVQISL